MTAMLLLTPRTKLLVALRTPRTSRLSLVQKTKIQPDKAKTLEKYEAKTQAILGSLGIYTVTAQRPDFTEDVPVPTPTEAPQEVPVQVTSSGTSFPVWSPTGDDQHNWGDDDFMYPTYGGGSELEIGFLCEDAEEVQAPSVGNSVLLPGEHRARSNPPVYINDNKDAVTL